MKYTFLYEVFGIIISQFITIFGNFSFFKKKKLLAKSKDELFMC